MPGKKKHLEIVKLNYETLSHLSKPNCSEHTDWCVTIIFYMALHFVQAYLAEKKSKHITNHSTLQNEIRHDQNLRPIYKNYRHLQDDSENARYLGDKLPIYLMRSSTLQYFKIIQDKISTLIKISNSNKHDLYPLFPN